MTKSARMGVVGISKDPGYLYYEFEMLSLGSINVKQSDRGTRITFIWREPTEICGTVAEAPLSHRRS